MKSGHKIAVVLLVVATIVGVGIYNLGKSRERALATLVEKYGVEIDDQEGSFYATISGDSVVNDQGEMSPNPFKATLEAENLVEIGRLLKKSGKVNGLSLLNFPKLKTLDGLQSLEDLNNLVIIDCPALVDSKGVGKLENLTELVIVDCAEFVDLQGIGNLKNVRTLDLSGCETLKSVPELSSIPDLESLLMSACFALETLDLSANTELVQIQLDGCRSLKTIKGLEGLINLTDLSLGSCHSLESLAGLDKLQSLIMLDARNIDIVDFAEVGKLSSLAMLRLAGQDGLKDLTPFTGLTELKELHLEAMPELVSLKGFPAGVDQFAGFPHCMKLTSLEGIQVATSLGSIDMTGCSELRDISAIAACKGIVQANFMNCNALTDIKPLIELKDLGFVLLGGTGVAEAMIGEIQKQLPSARFDFSGGN